MATGDEVQLVIFRVGGQSFAFNIFQVERILRYEAPTPLPQAPAFLEGMLSYGDGLVPVVDFRKRLETDAPLGDDTRIMILDWEQGRVGVVVDAVQEVKKVPAERITPPPEVVKGLAAEYISGVMRLDGRTVVILSPGKLLTSTERVALEELMVHGEASHE